MKYCIDAGDDNESSDRSEASSKKSNAAGDDALTDIGQFKPERAPRRPRGDDADEKATTTAGDVQQLLVKYGTGKKV